MTSRRDAPLTVVYAALAGGVLVFAAAVWLLGPPLGEGMDAAPWRWLWLAVALGAVLLSAFLTRRSGSAAAAGSRASPAIITWALAEGQAMVGLVGWLLTGDAVPGVAGLLVGLYLFARYRPAAFRGWRHP